MGLLPEFIDNKLSFVKYLAATGKRMLGGSVKECVCCGYQGTFRGYGRPPRFDALCPSCGSLERHRLLAGWVKANLPLVSSAKVLHFAPEQVVKDLLKRLAGSYVSADIDPARADIVIDIEKIALPEKSIDIVVCSHVLEHVNDRAALAEIHRILVPGGLAILMFPIVEGWAHTYEDASVTSEEGRLAHFGQEDHVRYYGADVRDRIRAAGFDLEEVTAEGTDVLKYGLVRGEKIFLARRPAS